MAETITCTACGANLKVSARPAAGRKLKCPKCQEMFTITDAPKDSLEERARDGDKAPAKLQRNRDEDDDRPATKSSRQRDDDDDDRPAPKSSRRRDDDDDDRDDAPRKKASRPTGDFEFDGAAGDFFVVYIICFLLTIFTFGLAFPWTICKFEKWKAEHTLIKGRRLRFDGTGSNLLGLFIVTYFFIIITLGIHMFWAVPKIQRWILENTSFDDDR